MTQQQSTDPCHAASAALVQAAYRITSQSRPAEALAELVYAARRAAVSMHAALLLRDPAADAWHITLLVAPSGNVAPLAALGVPSGPLELEPAPLRAVAPLAVVFGPAWGIAGCALAARRLDAEMVLSVPLPAADGPTAGMVMAFMPRTAVEQASVVVALLLHAALAASRHLSTAPAGSGDGLLPSVSLASAATREVDRAGRFGRPLAVVAAEVPRVADLAHARAALTGLLDPWDIAGRLDGDRARLAVVLPDASRTGVRRIVDAIAGAVAGAQVAAAWHPDDGRAFARLAMIALGRAGLGARGGLASDQAVATPVPPLFTWTSPSAERPLTWRRGLPLGVSAETVRCPRCLAPYSLRTAGSLAPAALEQALAAARDMLHASCPRHTDELRTAA